MKQELSELVQSVLKQLNLEDLPITITPTQDPSHGDYAMNVAFQAAKQLKTSPLEAAEKICQELRTKGKEQLSKIEVAKPGFINFTLSTSALLESAATEHKKLGSSSFKDRKIMIEFTDPNPFKEFHIGHLYSNIVGESIARLLEAAGAEVKRVCYQGDVGLHVAKSLWGMRQLMANNQWQMADLEKRPLEERVKFLGQAYALGAARFEEDQEAKKEIIAINKQVYEIGSSPTAPGTNVSEMYTKGRQWTLEYFETIYARLGTTFWHYYFESEAGPIGVDLVKEYLGRNIFRESEGAVIFPGEDHGLHTRVFINSLGLPTYEAKELGLAPTKYKDYPYDLSIIVTGNEINEYFKVLIKALSLIYPDLAGKTRHISHGMVRLPEGKMSSRTGNVKTGEWLLDEAKVRAAAKIAEVKEEKTSRVNATQEDEISEIVGVGAVKWALLRSGIGRDIEFSFAESVSFEGNCGPYIQYTFVRTQSVLAKANERDLSIPFDPVALHPEERQLLVYLTRYDDIVTEAAERFAPNLVTTYLFELAQLFNLFYQKYPILKEKGEVRDLRLFLTGRVGETIKEGLYLLGIKSPEKM
ncbi:MAG TPA: arginine--tRNA ligase [Patescibacteria group bacterium]|nr:arginine--tRNA ligase [Patescibacteria group bacterium]